MADREPAAPLDAQHIESVEFQRRYGPWESPDPVGAARLLNGAPFPWWVAGGWSLELDEQPRREHADIDIGLFLRDVDAVRSWFADLHLWEAHDGTLRPLLPGGRMTEGREQLWVRRDASSPWLLDLVFSAFSPGDGDTWRYKRDERVSLPLTEAVRSRADGVPMQAPEVTLLFKAKAPRAKDEADLAAVLPRLDVAARGWLRESLELTEPGHAWLGWI